MPRIPTAGEDLRTRVPRAGGTVVQMGDGGMGRAMQGAVANVQGIVKQEVEFDNRFRVASAESGLLIGSEKLLAELADADYETYQKRYDEGMQKIRADVGKRIKSPRDLAAFELRADQILTRGQLDVAARAKAMEVDRSRGQFDTDLAGLTDTALIAGDMSIVLESANELITGAIQQGIVKAEEGEQARRNFAVNVATRRLEMMPPEARIAALKASPESGLLPADVKAMMEEKASAEILTRNNLQRTMQRQAQEDLYEQAYETIMAADGDLSKVNVSDFRGLRPSQYDSLKELAAKRSAGYAVITDPDAYYKLKLMAGDPAQREAFADVSLSDQRHLLSESDYKTLVTAQAEARGEAQDGVADGITTENAVIKSALSDMEIPTTGADAVGENARKAALFTRMVEQRKLSRMQELGLTKNLPREELYKIVDDLTKEVAIQKDWWFDSTARAWEQEVPDSERAQIIEALEEEGSPVNEAAIRNLYIDLQRKRSVR